MPDRRGHLAFRAFVTEQNLRAPTDQMLYALEGEARLDQHEAKARALVEQWLAEVEGEPVGLREVLGDRVRDLLVDRDPGRRRRSMLDLVTTGRVTEPQVYRLLAGYGIDLETREGLLYAREVFDEAVLFFDEYVTRDKGPAAKVPPILKQLSDGEPDPDVIYRVFKTAAGVEGRDRQIPIACALLRIAHVVDLAKTHPRLHALSELAPVIEHRLKDHISALPDGKGYLFQSRPGDTGIFLHRWAIRQKHPFSIYAKLLHKPEVDVESIRDLMGALFMTRRPEDTLKLMYALFFDPDHAIFPPTLLDPVNGDQLLFDPTALRAALTDPHQARVLVTQLSTPVAPEDMSRAALELYGEDSNARNGNVHSAQGFRILKGILDFRAGGVKRAPRSRVRPSASQDLTLKLAPALRLPIEVQFADLETIYKNEGEAPHASYKGRQREAVHDRLLGRNLLTEFLLSRARR